MKLSIFIAFAATSSGTLAFQPSSNKAPFVRDAKIESFSPVKETKASPLTRHDMVAIRSPFWQAFSPAKADPKIDYVVDRDYFVPLTLIVVGIWLALFGPTSATVDGVWQPSAIDLAGAGFHIWFGAFIGEQTMKTRAVFNKDSFELKTVTNKVLGVAPDKGLMPKKTKNYVLGTTNKWKYSSFVNWDFFPSIHLPILVFFKETQTPKDQRIHFSVGSRKLDHRDNGQMHWFPAYCNVWQLREQFEAHGCKKIGPVHGEEFMKKQ